MGGSWVSGGVGEGVGVCLQCFLLPYCKQYALT